MPNHSEPSQQPENASSRGTSGPIPPETAPTPLDTSLYPAGAGAARVTQSAQHSHEARAARGSIVIPEAEALVAHATRQEMDDAVAALQAGKSEWAGLSVEARVAVLDRLIGSLRREGPAWIDSALAAKGIDPTAPQAGEEWLAGPVSLARNLRLLRQSLQDIADRGLPRLPYEPRELPNGQVAVQVFPTNLYDKLLFCGFSGEIRMKPEVELGDLESGMAAAYRSGTPQGEGKVCLVLGAGNVSSIGPMDILYKLFVENQVVALKMNPVNEYLGPHFEKIFSELIESGALRVVYGGAQQGQYLCNHPEIDEIHITGSDKTHDAIVFGGGPDGAERKRARQPILDKRITSELGNVSPVIVVPGPWSESDLAFQGENLASMLANNAGFNCNATRVMITDKSWPQRQALLDSVEEAFSRAPARKAYYPGAKERYEAFLEEHPEAVTVGGDIAGGKLPWMIVPGLDPSKKDDICFTTEAFCSVTSEVPLQAKSVVEFIEKAVEFANDTVWGSLNASIIVHPKSLRDPEIARAVERAIDKLEMGSVAVNHWAALSYAFVSTTWGAFPKHDIFDIGSGMGVVHNTYMFDKPEKSVIRGPFHVFPKPAWFVTNNKAHEIGRKLFEFECAPSAMKLPGILWDALRG